MDNHQLFMVSNQHYISKNRNKCSYTVSLTTAETFSGLLKFSNRKSTRSFTLYTLSKALYVRITVCL